MAFSADMWGCWCRSVGLLVPIRGIVGAVMWDYECSDYRFTILKSSINIEPWCLYPQILCAPNL